MRVRQVCAFWGLTKSVVTSGCACLIAASMRATLDLQGAECHLELDAERGENLIRANLHGEHTVGVPNITIIARYAQDRISQLRVRRFADQQSLGLSREQQ